jgi:hypothetical protein
LDFWVDGGFDWRFGEVSCSGLPSLGGFNLGGEEIGIGWFFEGASTLPLDFAA